MTGTPSALAHASGAPSGARAMARASSEAPHPDQSWKTGAASNRSAQATVHETSTVYEDAPPTGPASASAPAPVTTPPDASSTT